jgi:ATP-dependent 26S proteasome regulatory subunit
MEDCLIPAQQQALAFLEHAWPIGSLFALSGADGSGRTTVLREMHRRRGGAYLALHDFLDVTRHRHPLALEEAFTEWVLQNLQEHTHVFVDDISLLEAVVQGCSPYPRSGLLQLGLLKLYEFARSHQRKLVFAGGHCPWILHERSFHTRIGDFTPDDYAQLCRTYLETAQADHLDFAKIHRFAPNLNARQLESSCVWLRREANLDTERFIDFLRSQHLTSNVDLEEVQPVSLYDLQGVEGVIEALETHIILPLENDALAAEWQLRPKRGVLLAGPPGTGKTTVGRALAHRLRSKFFLVDGTVISGTGGFYYAIENIFQNAIRNAPSILFIDDSDVIFESGEELGLYRYLLTMLDGLESNSAARVCVMLTAMDVGHIPPALLRSGRVELWLEMRLPDLSARTVILERHLAGLPATAGAVDAACLAEATSGFTGADLKRLVEDGKNLYAYDLVRQIPPRTLTEYFLSAAETVRANRDRYAVAETRARQQHPERPVYFDATVEN